LRGRPRGGINKKDMCVIKGRNCFQHLYESKLGKIEKVYMICNESGIKKVACGAVIIPHESCFCVEKIYKQSYKQENKQEAHIKYFLAFS